MTGEGARIVTTSPATAVSGFNEAPAWMTGEGDSA